MENIYEIKEYVDGGPNDKGSTIGFIKATSKEDARKKANIKDGFRDVILIDNKIYNQRKIAATKIFNMFKY